jgi:dUTP pyrophosphatase
MTEVEIYIKVNEGGNVPVYASPQAAGCDLFAAEDIVIRPGDTVIAPLGITIALPEGTEAQIRPRSGLSLRTELRLPNSPGTVDSDYRNPVGVLLENTFNPALLPDIIAMNPDLIDALNRHYRAVTLQNWLLEKEPMSKRLNTMSDDAWQPCLNTTLFLDELDNPYGTIYIKKGDRIAQMIISRHLRARFIEHPDPSTVGHDRGGGFGSTGI